MVSVVISVANACGTLVVHDPIQTGQQAASEVLNYVQWLNSQVNSLNSYVTQAEQLVRYGNPNNYISQIPGISSVAQLANTGMTLVRDYQTVQSLINPQRYQNSVASIMAAYQQPNWQGAVSSLGVGTNVYQGNVQFQASQYQVVNQINTLIGNIEQEKQQIQQQLANDTQLMNSATDNSGVTKYAAMIASLQTSLAELNARESQLQNRAQLLLQQINAAQGVYRNVQQTQAASLFQQSAEAGMLPSGDYIVKGTEFGAVDNPAIGGSGDPGNGGNWYTGTNGNYIGGYNSTGVSLPASVERSAFGSVAAAQGQYVTVTNMNTGQSSTTQIVDVGPGSSTGAGVDLTYQTARAVGLPVNGSAPIKVSLPFATSLVGAN